MLKLRKMTETEFKAFAAQSQRLYIQNKMRANGLTQREAEEIAAADFARILPHGFLSKNNYLFTLVDSAEHDVGYTWYCVRGAENNRKAFICDIYVRESFRGRGFGRQAMTRIEEHAKAQGLKHIGLHVFGFNEVAISLYKSLGYQTTDLVMEKTLAHNLP
jgi:ribosomal protein S18 acetylase RimI-like enzyme